MISEYLDGPQLRRTAPLKETIYMKLRNEIRLYRNDNLLVNKAGNEEYDRLSYGNNKRFVGLFITIFIYVAND